MAGPVEGIFFLLLVLLDSDASVSSSSRRKKSTVSEVNEQLIGFSFLLVSRAQQDALYFTR
eukprot:scaffold8450_cov179-Ochromonas_danica.AAC.2